MGFECLTRGVTRGWAGDLVPTLRFYKNRALRVSKKFRASRNSAICLPYLNPGDDPLLNLDNLKRFKCSVSKTKFSLNQREKNIRISFQNVINSYYGERRKKYKIHYITIQFHIQSWWRKLSLLFYTWHYLTSRHGNRVEMQGEIYFFHGT